MHEKLFSIDVQRRENHSRVALPDAAFLNIFGAGYVPCPEVACLHVFPICKFAFRQLRNSPGFALTAVLMLAFGIGATTAIFSIVEGVILRPLPFPNSDRLVMLAD